MRSITWCICRASPDAYAEHHLIHMRSITWCICRASPDAYAEHHLMHMWSITWCICGASPDAYVEHHLMHMRSITWCSTYGDIERVLFIGGGIHDWGWVCQFNLTRYSNLNNQNVMIIDWLIESFTHPNFMCQAFISFDSDWLISYQFSTCSAHTHVHMCTHTHTHCVIVFVCVCTCICGRVYASVTCYRVCAYVWCICMCVWCVWCVGMWYVGVWCVWCASLVNVNKTAAA